MKFRMSLLSISGFFSDLQMFKWSVVEQENFVKCGQDFFCNEQLKFYLEIDTCLQYQKPDAILLSGFIQCLENHYEFLEALISYNFSYILIDRIALIEGNNDRLTVQKVPPEIYDSSYPSWFFNENKFLDYFKLKYELIFDFDGSHIDKCNIETSTYKGLIFKLKQYDKL